MIDLHAAELAKRAGLSATTIRNWTRRQPALVSARTPDGKLRFSWADFISYCKANPGLRGAARVLRGSQAESAQGGPSTPLDPAVEAESLRAVARDLKTACQRTMDALVTAARLAEETARAHREQLEQLTTTMAAYDAALSQMTAPRTLND